MGKDVRELTGADLFEAAFGERPAAPLTIEVWKAASKDAKVEYLALPDVPRTDSEPILIESPAFGQDAVDLKRCPHGKVVCRICPHDGRPYIDSEAALSDSTLRDCGFEPKR